MFSEKKTANHTNAKNLPAEDIQKKLRPEILRRAKNNQIPCAVAFDIAKATGASPKEIGQMLDFLEQELTKCQLGLFGYQPDKKILKPLVPEDPALKAAIENDVAEGRLACKAAWEIAAKLKLPKMSVSNACEALGIKVKPCQLGAF